MKTLAAVLVEPTKPLELAELEIPTLAAGQVLVEILYSGVCHTQVGEWLGWRGPDPFLPHCMGHEAYGRVLEISSGVTRCRPGDEVVLSWIKAAGQDVPGTVYRWGNRNVNAGGVTTFSQHAVVSENRISQLSPGVTPRAAALLGCAAATGFGSVLNTAQLQKGESIAVFGVGGIGLCAVAAAAAIGATAIAAIDTRPARLEVARRLGATNVIDASETSSPKKALAEIAPRGWDRAIDATGVPGVAETALSVVRPRGGAVVFVGNTKFGETLRIDPREFNQGKRFLGTWGGDTSPDRDFPIYCDWITRGLAPIEQLLDREYGIQDVNAALSDLHTGQCTRPLLNMQR